MLDRHDARRHFRRRLVGVVGSALLLLSARLGRGQEGGEATRPPADAARPGERESLTAAGSEAGELERPDWLGGLTKPLNPGRLQRRLDEWLGLDAGDRSRRPEAPEVPEPVFLEFIRPLGALKYENELNYLIVAPTGRVPAAQFLEYEYVFADWNAVKLEMEFSQGSLETLEPGYQRTLGVGRRGNWIHGFQIFPEIYMQERFVGGTAAYMFNWKPTAESKFSTSLWAGGNRAQVQGPRTPDIQEMAFRPGRPHALARETRGGEDKPVGVWRPLAVADFWYTLSPNLAVGIENDVFASRVFGEYLVLPHVNWQPSQHVFVQAGLGYYRFGPVDQAVFMLHVNLVNPSPRRPRPRDEQDDRDRPADDRRPGSLRRLFDRVSGALF